MNARIEDAGEISLDAYDVLLALEESPERRLTMRELAVRAILSPSGVTRLVDRLVEKGWVRREVNERDRRSYFAVLTDNGLQMREKAWPAYCEAIQAEFAQHLTTGEASHLAELLQRFLRPGVGTTIYTQDQG